MSRMAPRRESPWSIVCCEVWTKEIPGAAPFDSFIAAGPSNSLAFIDSDYTVHLKWNDDW